jgi:perosamine synthetase
MTSSFDRACDALALLRRPLSPATTPETLAFETALRRYFGVKHAVAVSSGTAALHCALAALHIGPEDEVLVPSLAVIMSIVPVLYQGATPIFVDCALDRVDFDYEDLERKLSPRVKAILPVHLWGAAYDMARLTHFAKSHRVAVIEDACQAHGSRWENVYLGTWGEIGCFSMRDGKIVSTGEGGFLLTDDPALAEHCRAFRSHWANPHNPRCSYQHLGQNYRLSEMQAWLGRKHIEILDTLLARRAWQVQYLLDGLLGVSGITPYCPAPQEQSNGFSPVFLLDEALVGKHIAQKLAERGVPNSVGTFGLRPAQEWPIFSAGVSQPVVTPHAQQLLARVLAISLLPQYTAKDLDRIIVIIKTTLAEVC